MKQFKELGIKAESKGLEGEKIRIEKIFNREITVIGYKIEKSKYEGKGNCLYMQILLGSEKRIVFTGSYVLQEMIQKIGKDDFPFTTTIIKENERYEFT